MSKHASAPSKKSRYKQILFYLLGTIFLLGIVRVRMLQHSSVDLTDVIADYIFHKQEVAALMGDVNDLDYVTRPTFEVSKKYYDLALNLKGSKANGLLRFQMFSRGKEWRFDNVTLKINGEVHRLSSAYVPKTEMFASSLSSAPLRYPAFLEGEDMYVRLWLKGVLPLNKGDKIVESLDIYNDSGALVASKKEADIFSAGEETNPSHDPVGGVQFTSAIKDLVPGSYTLAFKFEDQAAQVLDVFRKTIVVRAPKEELTVSGVNYFLDEARTKKTSATFTPGQKIFLSLGLDGFKVQDSKIAGLVDLKILDDDGKIVASKPRFSAFNQTYDMRKNIVVDGDLTLKDPGVYFLSFRVQDYFSDRELKHYEKVIVKLGN